MVDIAGSKPTDYPHVTNPSTPQPYPTITDLSKSGQPEYENSEYETTMTPCVSGTSERSSTPKAESDEAAELNLDVMGDEIDRSLAEAMGTLADLLARRRDHLESWDDWMDSISQGLKNRFKTK